MSTADMMRPDASRGNRRLAVAPTATVKPAPATRWKVAGDAVVAAQRLGKKEETRVYKPEEGKSPERRVKVITGATAIQTTLKQQQLAQVEQRRLAGAGVTAHTAAKVGDAATMGVLVQREGASIAKWQDENAVTPLLMASAYGRLACTEVLCAAGADVNHVNVWGSTPLINAAHNAHAEVVRFLILSDAIVSTRDKDGTALDGSLRRLVRMVRGVNSSTDDKHPDKPGLAAASEALTSLAAQTARGPVWHGQLEAALAPFRKLLCQAESAEAKLNIGRAEPLGAGGAAPVAAERPSSAASKGSDKSKKGGKKKAADGPEPPDEGRSALYKGMAAYVRCIEMLRDPSQVKKDEKLRTGSGAAAEGGGVLAVDGLTQKVGRIRTALALDVALALPEVLRQANVAMGTEQSGSLPEQTDRLVLALGLQ